MGYILLHMLELHFQIFPNLIRDYGRAIGEDFQLTFGGLNISNVENALSITSAPVVDVSSGVETEKGVKCEKKIKNLITYLKNGT